LVVVTIERTGVHGFKFLPNDFHETGNLRIVSVETNAHISREKLTPYDAATHELSYDTGLRTAEQ
jgi:hypothetical protein